MDGAQSPGLAGNSGRRVRTWSRVVAAVLVSSVAAAVIARAPVAASAEGLTWDSAGDSYSSGEGVWGNQGDCARSDQAYGPLVADRVGAAATFTACSGARLEDYFGPGSLWSSGRDPGAPDRVDVITMSFGGNDIGFGGVIADCIPVPDSWTSLLTWQTTVIDAGSGCDVSEAELMARIDWLVDPARECEDDDAREHGSYDCALDLGDRRGSIVDAYYDIVTQRLNPGGRLFVVSYPSLVAPHGEWPWWAKVVCSGILRGDAAKLSAVATHFNDKLSEAVGRANEALGGRRVVFVDNHAAYRSGKHELCGKGPDWMNGPAYDRGDGSVRRETSYHPNAEGHEGTAAELERRFWENPPEQPDPCVSDPPDSTEVLALMNAKHPAPSRTISRIDCVAGWVSVQSDDGKYSDGFVYLNYDDGWEIFYWAHSLYATCQALRGESGAETFYDELMCQSREGTP